MKKNHKIKLLIILTFSFLWVRGVSAASLDLNITKTVFKENESFVLTLLLNGEGESINAVEGDIKYNENAIKAETVNTGGSFVSFWVEQPNLKNPGTLHFSGITPGGVSAAGAEVFRVVFRTQKVGDTSLSLKNVSLLLNDGNGSSAEVGLKDLNIKIYKGESTEAVVDTVSSDKTPPEKFMITRTKDKSIFNNKYFIVFSSIDKGTGISHYKVCELFKCVIAESPFMLWNQTPFYFIVVNAYDANGNHVSSTLISPYLIWLIIIILLNVTVFFFRRYLRLNKV